MHNKAQRQPHSLAKLDAGDGVAVHVVGGLEGCAAHNVPQNDTAADIATHEVVAALRDVNGSDWSIAFPAAATSGLQHLLHDLKVVKDEHNGAAGANGDKLGVDGDGGWQPRPTLRVHCIQLELLRDALHRLQLYDATTSNGDALV